jgi:D-tyrosyl-tRNA(Tyr) deacylase
MDSIVVLQRVKSASVTVDGNLISSIGKGILAFAAIEKNDTLNDSIRSASKLLKMKLWDDENGGRVSSILDSLRHGVDCFLSGNAVCKI